MFIKERNLFLVLYLWYSFNSQRSLSTHLNNYHTLQNSFCGFWKKKIWLFFKGRTLFLVSYLWYSFNFQRSLSKHLNNIHTLNNSICGIWKNIFWLFIKEKNLFFSVWRIHFVDFEKTFFDCSIVHWRKKPFLVLYLWYSFNFQRSLSTRLNTIHTLENSLCGFSKNIFWLFIKERNLFLMLYLWYSFNSQRSLTTHLNNIHTLENSLCGFWRNMFHCVRRL
jgi:Ca2+/Na+ antiporter